MEVHTHQQVVVSQAIPKRSNLVLGLMGCNKVQSNKDMGLHGLQQQLLPVMCLTKVQLQQLQHRRMAVPTWLRNNNMATRQAVGLCSSKHTLPTARLHHLMVTTMEHKHLPLLQLTSSKMFSQLLLLMISLVPSKLQQLDMVGKYLQPVDIVHIHPHSLLMVLLRPKTVEAMDTTQALKILTMDMVQHPVANLLIHKQRLLKQDMSSRPQLNQQAMRLLQGAHR